MFRLAHISDIHLGPLPELSARQLASKRITGYVNWRINRQHQHGAGTVDDITGAIANLKPSHTAITGDLVNLGLDSEIEQAREWLSALGSDQSVSVVPGNHDAYVPGSFRRACDAWRPWMEGDQPPHRPNPFPYMRVRGNVALIGLSSARASAPFMATGYFRNRQAIAFAALLDEAELAGLCKVVMIHHPPVHRATAFHKRLVGIDRFQRVIKKHGAELILHGHTHLPTLAWIEGKTAKVPVVGVSAAGQAPGGRLPAAQFNLLEIDGKQDGWRINLTRHNLDGSVEKQENLSANGLEKPGILMTG